MDKNDDQSIVSRDVLVKQGVSSLLCMGGGVFLFVMAFGAQHGLLGIVLSGAALLVGIGALLSKEVDSKKPGLLIAAAGLLGMIIRFVRVPPLQAMSGTVLTIGALGLLAAAVWKGIKFFRGLKTRQ